MATWIKLLDDFTEHHKVLAAGEDAAWVFVSGLLYCSRNLTDGRIPRGALPKITAKRNAAALAAALVREGMWIETEGGWEVHNYLSIQRSRAEIEDERVKGRARAKRSRERRANGDRSTPARSLTVRATEVEGESETDSTTPQSPPADFDHHPVDRIDPDTQQQHIASVHSIREQQGWVKPRGAA